MSIELFKQVISESNIFTFDSFWKAQGKGQYKSVCGGLVSLPLVVIIFILLVLKLVQMVNYGIVMSNSQVNYNYQPMMTTFSTNQKDSSYAPFMLGFSTNIDTSTCSTNSISFEAYANDVTGAYNSPNRVTSKAPINFETCTDQHFGMLPGKLSKIKQWTSSSLTCIPLNSYFHIGGANTISDFYKNIEFKFSCSSSCSNVTNCGTVEFYSASSAINLGNSSDPYAYGLTRHRFTILTSPKNQISYQLDSFNTTSDNSIFPFSLNKMTTGTSVGNVITDLPSSSADKITYITIERSDKTMIYKRSYYKIFDLLAYMGGVVYGIIILLFFIRNFSKLQFELNFAAEYFRIKDDQKKITFRDYLKQLSYQFLKHTPLKPDWKLAQKRQDNRQAAKKVLDVIYLNKRIAFLQEAISLLFEKHQLKAIHLLHSLDKNQQSNKIKRHRLRDRVIYFLGRKYYHENKVKVYEMQDQKEFQLQKQAKNVMSAEIQSKKREQQQLEQSYPILKGTQSKVKIQLKQSGQPGQLEIKPRKITLKHLLNQKMIQEEQIHGSSVDSLGSLIINEAENYYSEEDINRRKFIVNSKEDNSSLKKELNFIGDLDYQEFSQNELIQELQNEIRILVQEGLSKNGDVISRKIYQKLDGWLKNYLRDTFKTKIKY